MHNWVLKLVIVSLLFVSMEGFADSVDETSFHQTHHAHADEAGAEWFPDSDGSDHESEACEHFCHAHVVALIARFSTPSLPVFQHYSPLIPTLASTRATAPPTPPPNT